MVKQKALLWFTALALILACVPTFAAPIPTADPNAVGTFIAQTAIAASTQTADAQPTLTYTPTLTPTQLTDTPSPTATATVIFVLSTPTPLVLPTSTFLSGSGGTSSADFSCQVLSVSPANGSTLDGRENFDAVWQVRNNGQRTWDRNSVDFLYDSGDRIHRVAGFDLNVNVRSGETVGFSAPMEAPQSPGTYSTTWTLRVGDNEFCRMSITIVVR